MRIAKWWQAGVRLSLASIALVSSGADAAGNAVASAKIVAVHIESGVPFLSFDKAIANPDSCPSVAYVTLGDDLPHRDSYISLAMTALASGKTVSVWVNGCGWAPWNAGVPKVYAMQIVP